MAGRGKKSVVPFKTTAAAKGLKKGQLPHSFNYLGMISLPGEFGAFQLKWDPDKFTGIIPIADNKAVLHYGGKEFPVVNPEICLQLIESRGRLDLEIETRVEEIKNFNSSGMIGVGCKFDFFHSKYRSLHTIHWEFNLNQETSLKGNMSDWTIDVRICLMTVRRFLDGSGNSEEFSEEILDIPTINLKGVDVTKLTKRDIEYGVYDIFIHYVKGLEETDVLAWDLDRHFRGTNSVKTSEILMKIELDDGSHVYDIRPKHGQFWATSPNFPIRPFHLVERSILPQHLLDIELEYISRHDARMHEVTLENIKANSARRVAEINAAARIQAAKIAAEAQTEASSMIATALSGLAK